MTKETGQSQGPEEKQDREKRLAEALRANLKRRKDQRKKRDDDDGPQFRQKPVPKFDR